MRKAIILLAVLLGLTGRAFAAEELVDTGAIEAALPQEARELLGAEEDPDLGRILSGAVERSGGALKTALGLCSQIFCIVLLTALLRGQGASASAMVLAGVLAIGSISLGSISGFFSTAARTVDTMTRFSGFLFAGLATAAAAGGAVGTSTALYGITALVCSVMTQVVETLFLPGISCYMALMIADSAVGDGSLKLAGDTLKQFLGNGLKLAVLGFTAYLSVTGVIRGSADTAAIKAAKLTISTAVPVVGSMIADASETLLVSADLLRGSLGVFGMLGVLAMGILPFCQTGCQYLLLKGTAAAAGAVGEKELSGLIQAMAGAVGLLTAVTGTCTLMLLIGCVCFLRVNMG